MFVYKYMSGVMENVVGTHLTSTDGEDFDPHKHRLIPKPTSYIETMIHLLKGSIGAGLLAMPEAISRVGVIFGFVGLIILASFCVYCLDLLISSQYKLCKRWRRGYIAYPKSMRLAVQDGPPFFRPFANLLSTFVDAVLVIWQLGVCTVYFIFVSQNVRQNLIYFGYEVEIRMLLAILLIPSVLLNLIRDLKLLAPVSSVSNATTSVAIMLVGFYLIEDDVEWREELFELKSLEGVAVFIGISLFSMEAVGVMLALEYNMENPKQFLGKFGILNIGMSIVISLYLLVGCTGYLKYGDDIKSSITLNLPEDQKKAQVAKILFAFSIFLSFPLQNFVAYSILWKKWKKKLNRQGRKNTVVCDYILRVLCVLIPWVLATALPHLGPFISLFGAFCLSLLAIIFPAIMDLCWWYSASAGYGTLKYRLFRGLFIVAFGMICMCSGVFVSILEFQS